MAKSNERQRIVQVMERSISPEEQGTYIEIPFRMPEGAEEIRVHYEVESAGDARAVIDLGIRDASRVRGWSGGARKEFRLARVSATPGYLAGALTPGDWAVLHNAYRVPEGGCKVKVTLEIYLKTHRWLKGDLHTHSVHSDGAFTLEENAAAMERLGCDFIAMTDHNTNSQNLAYPRNTEVLMIPGTEFTTNFGHSNFLGVVDPMDDFRVADMKDVREKFRIARERGAKIVLNHPHCSHCPWEWDFDVDFDWVEVWNGIWSERNERALRWWQEQLASGRRLTAVGGSDFHRDGLYNRLAMPCTWVWTDEKSAEGVLGGIDRGCVLITYEPNGPFAELTCGEYRMGDVVPAEERFREVTCYMEDLRTGDTIKWISERGIERVIEITENHPKMVITGEGAGRRFVRVEIWRRFEELNLTMMAALVNPIYFDDQA